MRQLHKNKKIKLNLPKIKIKRNKKRLKLLRSKFSQKSHQRKRKKKSKKLKKRFLLPWLMQPQKIWKSKKKFSL